MTAINFSCSFKTLDVRPVGVGQWENTFPSMFEVQGLYLATHTHTHTLVN